MEVALYMRVSTSRQQQHQTIEQQLSRLHAYVALQPDWHVADEGLDHGMGHLASVRPENHQRLPPIKVETKGRPRHP